MTKVNRCIRQKSFKLCAFFSLSIFRFPLDRRPSSVGNVEQCICINVRTNKIWAKSESHKTSKYIYCETSTTVLYHKYVMSVEFSSKSFSWLPRTSNDATKILTVFNFGFLFLFLQHPKHSHSFCFTNLTHFLFVCSVVIPSRFCSLWKSFIYQIECEHVI